jgi:hypothetical protein
VGSWKIEIITGPTVNSHKLELFSNHKVSRIRNSERLAEGAMTVKILAATCSDRHCEHDVRMVRTRRSTIRENSSANECSGRGTDDGLGKESNQSSAE